MWRSCLTIEFPIIISLPRPKQLFCAVLALALTGCAAKSAVHIMQVPYKVRIDPKKCHYLPDGVKIQCKDAVLDPQVIDVKQSPR